MNMNKNIITDDNDVSDFVVVNVSDGNDIIIDQEHKLETVIIPIVPITQHKKIKKISKKFKNNNIVNYVINMLLFCCMIYLLVMMVIAKK